MDNLYLEPADAGAVLLDDDLLPPSLDEPDELELELLESLLPESLPAEVDDSEDEDVDDEESPFDELLDELLAASRLSVR
ncbi:hypothetical protein MARA_52000 [Mycolicibacterium arabiense]|uniref:Uncharacterized protein n=1 Tax=Mycolicibacterium arabiense TaxID=1286181 RepID=A0A7I7S4A7_9MYCO|nr:hypothetical protein MARA_52000 [Mycolicibacterium arabiense]